MLLWELRLVGVLIVVSAGAGGSDDEDDHPGLRAEVEGDEESVRGRSGFAPPDDAVRRMIRERPQVLGRLRRPRFTRVTVFPGVGELPGSVRAALDDIEPLVFGTSRVWAVAAETATGTYERTMLELWAHSPDEWGHPSHGLSPRLEASSIRRIVPSPYAPPKWMCDAAWRLPVVHDVTQVRFTASDGTTWVDDWIVFPAYFRIPTHVRWADVVDVGLYNVGGQLRPAERGMASAPIGPRVVHCPFTVPDGDPLGSHEGRHVP